MNSDNILFKVYVEDRALVWYCPQTENFIIRHVFIEGHHGVFICNEHDSEFAPHWKLNGWEYIGEL